MSSLEGFYEQFPNRQEAVEKPRLVTGERSFKFSTNLSVPSAADLVTLADEQENPIFRVAAKKSIYAKTNEKLFYGECMRRGFGVISHDNAADINGNKLSSEYLAYYEDEALEPGTTRRLYKAITSIFPEVHNPFYEGYKGPLAEMTASEMREIMDNVLAEESFEEAQDHYINHVSTGGLRQATE